VGGQIVIIKFGVTAFLFIPSEEKNSEKEKKKTLYICKIIKPFFSSTFHHHSIMANQGTLPHLVFIMILSMGTQRGSIHLCTVISLYMNRKHVVRIDDCLLE